MPALLDRPYLRNTPLGHHVLMALVFGGFVFLFLFIFRPFGIYQLGDRLLLLTLGYGAVCTGVMLVLNTGVTLLFPHWFQEVQWTVGRELSWTALNVLCIGLANALYTVGVGLAPLSLATIATFTLFTLAVGVFPIALSVVLNEARLSREFQQRSRTINADLEQHEYVPGPAVPVADERITVPTEGHAQDMTLAVDALIIVRSAENYIEVFHRDGRTVERRVLRGSLKAVEEALSGNPRFMRCHKSHLVDLRKVQRVSGNAQGLKLHMDGMEELVPVSRQLTQAVRERLAAHP